jgi:hypothetical protein
VGRAYCPLSITSRTEERIVLPAAHTSRAIMREELRSRLEAAAADAAPGVFEFVSCPRTRTSDLDAVRMHELGRWPAGSEPYFTTLDALLDRVGAGPDVALRRLRRVLRANLFDMRVAVVQDRALIIGAAPTGGVAGLAVRMAPH